jgi:hypothetical protein
VTYTADQPLFNPLFFKTTVLLNLSQSNIMFALRRAAVRAIAIPRPAAARPFSVLGARLCKTIRSRNFKKSVQYWH